MEGETIDRFSYAKFKFKLDCDNIGDNTLNQLVQDSL
jgi:hypothetical protein